MKCYNIGGAKGLAAMSSSGWITDETWKCSPRADQGWSGPGFDDDHWVYAASVQKPLCFPDMNITNLKTIWDSSNNGYTYCRHTVGK